MCRDASETLDVFVEIETAIEAPLIAREITLGVLWVERATGAGDRALDVAETRVGPLEACVLGAPAAGQNSLMLEPGLGEAAEATEAVAQDARAGSDIGLCIGLDRLLREARDAPQVGVDRLVLTRGDGDDERDLVGRSPPCFSSLFAAQIPHRRSARRLRACRWRCAGA